ncbi:helix-turn-helix transcriptional regulator [Methylorubrum sp. SB2]|uniref:helix-turn-helix transcriptional regulator n=1 Tax=Methylorubrum subtropicum TaxID=3138812 RepID=UPI00313EDE28
MEDTLDLVGRIYDASLDAALWPAVLEEIGGFVNGVSAALFWQDAFDRSAFVVHSWGEDPHYTRLYLETYAALNPMFPAASFVEPGVVFTGGDIVPPEEMRATRFHREWLAPQGIVDAANVNLHRYATSTAAFSVRRSEEQGTVDAEARRRLTVLVPHLRRAARIGSQLAGHARAARDLEDVLAAAATAVFLVDDEGRLGFVNQGGRAMLEQGDILAEREGTLRIRDAEANRLVREAVTRPAPPADARKSVSIALSHTPPCWMADVLPLSSGARLRHGQGYGARAAVFVRRAEIPVMSGLEVLARRHGLTASEVRVLQAVTGGGSIDDIAAQLGLAVSTVKSHLKALFAKTGARSRVALVRDVAAHSGALR